MIEIVTLTLGPVQTNCYLVADSENGEAAVIDPAWSGELIVDELEKRGWSTKMILLTHAHFDHFAGCGPVAKKTGAPIALHRDDLPLWKAKGGATAFGIPIPPGPEPSAWIQPGEVIRIGGLRFDVLFLPGHTAGHVGFHDAAHGKLFSGDVIFESGIGRTDLPGGDYSQLMTSIREGVLTLPDATEIYPGHGPTTTVGQERLTNPFLAD